MSRVKIAVMVMVDGEAIWNLPLDTNDKAATRMDLPQYTKVVQAAETELKKQIKNLEKSNDKQEQNTGSESKVLSQPSTT